MAKKERNFHGEADFLRHQLRKLAEEVGTVIKDTNFMKKEECKEEIEALNRVKYRKEVEAETRANIENLKRELADRNNQITTLEKKKVIIENEKKNGIDIILEKDEKIEELKIEIKEFEGVIQEIEGKILFSKACHLKEKEDEYQKSRETIIKLLEEMKEKYKKLS